LAHRRQSGGSTSADRPAFGLTALHSSAVSPALPATEPTSGHPEELLKLPAAALTIVAGQKFVSFSSSQATGPNSAELVAEDGNEAPINRTASHS